MHDILDEICTAKRIHIRERRKQLPESRMILDIRASPVPRGFRDALMQKRNLEQIGLIAEIKKASPSRGVIRADFEPCSIAESYANAGASCLSVLTDVPYFQGDDAYISQVKEVCALPVLRKDFMLDTYQIVESRYLGADCILLIVAALENAQANELYAAASELGMDVLVEVHDEYELERACTHLPLNMLGVNNRNLKTLEVSLDVSKRLAKYIPENVLRVAESGIKTHADCQTLIKYDMSTFLVGESLMNQPDIQDATRKLLGFAEPLNEQR
jgi:indole-3-glycerol phosphate synthase